ncbi:hypothetical protein BDF19DRAFT_452253 [Syncephalis fuscata]|nr:hypothetical protein BDF19DRAFT_452253 [Syncephalis fuscata]
MFIFKHCAYRWLYQYLLALGIAALLFIYLLSQIMQLLHPVLTHQWSKEPASLPVPNILLVGAQSSMDNSFITITGQSSNANTTVDLSKRLIALKAGTDYVAADDHATSAWLLNVDPQWRLLPASATIDGLNRFTQLSIAVQRGSPDLPVDPATQSSLWLDPPRIYLIRNSLASLPINLPSLETQPWAFLRWNRRNYLIIAPQMLPTRDGQKYLVATHGLYNNYSIINLLESIVLILAIGIVAIVAIFYPQAAKSEPNLVRGNYTNYRRESGLFISAPVAISHGQQLTEVNSLTKSTESSLQLNNTNPTLVGNADVDAFSSDSNVTKPGADETELSSSHESDDALMALEESFSSKYSESLANSSIQRNRKYCYNTYSVQPSDEWTRDSQYYEGCQSEISIDISDGDIAVARHATIRSLVSNI